ncbi:MAG: hypothetical protein AVDCRST_MAG26-1980, partial [uncultured Chloroflexia bacterium]
WNPHAASVLFATGSWLCATTTTAASRTATGSATVRICWSERHAPMQEWLNVSQCPGNSASLTPS